jgi:hypothetical protein
MEIIFSTILKVLTIIFKILDAHLTKMLTIHANIDRPKVGPAIKHIFFDPMFYVSIRKNLHVRESLRNVEFLTHSEIKTFFSNFKP